MEINEKNYRLLLNKYEEILEDDQDVILYGFPLPEISNIGDYMIAIGLSGILEELDKEVHIYTHEEHIKEDKLPVIIRGGGWWSLSYPWANCLKELNNLKDRKVIISPMSIRRFSNEKIPFARNKVHAFFRDRRSLELFESANIPHESSDILPDCSVGAYREIESIIRNPIESIAILRNDDESIHREVKGYKRVEWSWSPEQKAELRNLNYEELKKYCLRYIKDRLGRAKYVITDRLHAHIISSMMGITNTLLPNSYHKNESYYFTWGWEYSNSRYEP